MSTDSANTPRYTLGIDLGTTHCALVSIDIHESDGEDAHQRPLHVAQLTAPGNIENRPLLPSFIYLPHPDELAPGDLSLPWSTQQDFAAGEFARTRGAATPIRLVSSAKSWLCHPGVDRRAAILPSDAPAEVTRISPLVASIRYLAHLKAAWDAAHPYDPFSEQDVTVTIPASFDPAARELTAEAAQAAGFGPITLLEEPQAALYSWIQRSAGQWRKEVKRGDLIVVIDVGGGTTDLSLIAVQEQDGSLDLTRVAVGDHILLGGDNMDLALAYAVTHKLQAAGTRLDPWQTRALAHGCRIAKESLLADDSLNSVPVLVPSRGARLVGDSVRTEVTRDELLATVIEGFFPEVAITDAPQSRARSALTQLGLPYAQDAAITRHIAAFLCRQRGATAELTDFAPQPAEARFLHPTAVLFNGGVFKSSLIAERLLAQLNAWLEADGAPPARMLRGADLDLAVANGAAYYGYARRGRGVRIRGGTASSYYVAIESAMPAIPGMAPPIEALCVAPFGMEEGTETSVEGHELGLIVGEPVRFRFFSSSSRRKDQAGTLLDVWDEDELQEHAEIEVTLPADGRALGEVVRVTLHAHVTETGTFELEASPPGGSERWKVEFDVRGGNAPRA